MNASHKSKRKTVGSHIKAYLLSTSCPTTQRYEKKVGQLKESGIASLSTDDQLLMARSLEDLHEPEKNEVLKVRLVNE